MFEFIKKLFRSILNRQPAEQIKHPSADERLAQSVGKSFGGSDDLFN